MKQHKFKSGFVTLIGRPNVGKSTLMNHLIGQKIAITSNKPQTTRNRIQTVYTDDRGQIIFLDTPGMNKAKNKLGEYMLTVATRTLNEVDVILWVVEASPFIGHGEQYIIEQLKQTKTPIILIVNKIDTTVKQKIAETMKVYEGVLPVVATVPVSALRSRNMEEVLREIFKQLPEGPQYYDENTVTDQPERQIVAELIREKALRCLEKEVPHGVAVMIETMKTRKNGEIVDIESTIICERDSHKGIIIGKNGAMLKKIGTQARIEMEGLLDTKVNLQLWVKVKKDWRDSDLLLKNYGYNKKEL